MKTYLCTIIILVILFYKESASFKIPDAIFEAYAPKGFRISIPAVDGMQLVGFHLNHNEPIQLIEPGNINQDVTSPTGDAWSYINENLKLSVGDQISSWVFVQHDRLGYRRQQDFTVTELVPKGEANCVKSSTIVSGKPKICSKTLILEELFGGDKINTNTWTVQQYLPELGPDYEFVSYQKQIPEIQESQLVIRPVVLDDIDAVKGELNLRDGCTSTDDRECYKKYGLTYLPPVTSGRVVSKLKFTYGTIEIKAKLPAGEWIYPQIYLEQVSNATRKIWIAYARGNDELKPNNREDDLGGRLLFGGPITSPTEPLRSKYLRTIRSKDNPYTSAPHTFKVKWDADGLIMFVDEIQYGKVEKSEMEDLGFSPNQLFQLVLGVGVGGVNDFPTGYFSSNFEKPWKNKSRTQLKDFFNSRNTWMRTWANDKSALQVTHVKIRAI